MYAIEKYEAACGQKINKHQTGNQFVLLAANCIMAIDGRLFWAGGQSVYRMMPVLH